MQLTKLNLILIALLVLQSAGLIAVALRMPKQPAVAEPAAPRGPEVKMDAKASAQALQRTIQIVDSALQRGSWTEQDGMELRDSLGKMNREDKRQTLDKIGDAVNRQTFKPGEHVVLPFDYF